MIRFSNCRERFTDVHFRRAEDAHLEGTNDSDRTQRNSSVCINIPRRYNFSPLCEKDIGKTTKRYLVTKPMTRDA